MEKDNLNHTSGADAGGTMDESPPGSGEHTGDSERKDTVKKRHYFVNILAAAAVLCALIGGVRWYKTRSSTDVYADIQKKAVEDKAETVKEAEEEKAPAAATAASTQAAAAAATTAAPAEEIPIDFETLWETCPEAYAWIRIPNTQIDYPVCQRVEGDQNFYLNHRADGVEEFAGAIYSQNYNTRDFTDPVTVLYGHDMSNGSMFQNLHFYEDRAFFDNNREVIVYLPNKVLHYSIFAAYNTNDDHLLLSNNNFVDPDVFYIFLQDILNQRSMSGFVDQNVELTTSSRILTLSTCNAYDDQRYLVQCLLMNPSAVMPDPSVSGSGSTGAASGASETSSEGAAQ